MSLRTLTRFLKEAVMRSVRCGLNADMLVKVLAITGLAHKMILQVTNPQNASKIAKENASVGISVPKDASNASKVTLMIARLM